MDGDYPEQVQVVDHDLDAYNFEDEYEQEQQHGIEIKSFTRVDDRVENEMKASVDPPHRDFSEGKLFVGGISWETTEESFSNYFSKYGELADYVIMLDKQSGRPRGFGFVTFVDSAVVDSVLEKRHVIDGRTVEVKRTVPREGLQSRGDSQAKGGISKTKKIFVGGIPPSFDEDALNEYFSSYGTIVEQQIMLDHQTGRSRGFAFVTFDSEDSVERIFAEGRTHELGGKQVEIKRAEPKRASDNGGSAKSYGGYHGNIAGYGGDKASGYASYGGYGNYGNIYGGSAGFYGGYGGYGYGYGFGGPMYGYGGYGNAGAYAAAAIYGGGSGGYGGYSGGGRGKGYGSPGGGADGVSARRYHPYQR